MAHFLQKSKCDAFRDCVAQTQCFQQETNTQVGVGRVVATVVKQKFAVIVEQNREAILIPSSSRK